MNQEIVFDYDDETDLAMYSDTDGSAVARIGDVKLVFVSWSLVEEVRNGLTELLGQ